MKNLLISSAIVALCAAPAWSEDHEHPAGIWAPHVVGDVEAELVASLPHGVGNIAFTPTGEIIYSHHPFYGNPVRVALMEADGQGFTPFPNAAWNTEGNPDTYLDTVLGIRGDADGIIWMSDMMHGGRHTPKLVGWNTQTDSLEVVLNIPEPATLPCNPDECSSQLNDFAIDSQRGMFYFADEQIGPGGDASRAAIVILDRETGESRRVLEGHYSTIPADVPIVVDGQPLTFPNGPDGTHTPILVGNDGITTDLDYEYLYYGALNAGWIYRLRIDDLLDESLTDAELGELVERYAVRPNAGGFSIDADNNIYFTAVESTYVGVIPSDTRRFRPYASHPDLQWPDGVSYNAADGHMYVSAAELAQLPPFNDGENYSEAPYHIFRFLPLAESVIGR